MKKCKQCGKTKCDTEFRPYYSRSTGKYKSSVGSNTICKECERINASVTRIWKRETKSEEDEKLLTQAAEYYKMLVANGHEPIGPFAKHVLGEASRQPEPLSAILSAALGTQDVINEFSEFMALEFTEDPQDYYDMLEAIEDKCKGPNGKVTERYREIDLQAITKCDDYNDKYWEEH